MPIYYTKWEHRALFNNTNNTHTHTYTHARTHTHTHASDRGDRHSCEQVKKVIEQVQCVLRTPLKEEAESEWQSV